MKRQFEHGEAEAQVYCRRGGVIWNMDFMID